ncbi:high frequency lysogenization protein HflD [Veronia pacifica]|uniref:High frequency lysogenization protein HflD homolog n=1 Tax=Veronia pacifica TaxID=1080227 RepID=A0A1C3EM04_9GAMM|nr:high frequency lysogenization protein HflD [Veronia pacifica]ODA34259.1 lysogenization protein HflD [Veronia pacifica]
MANTSYDRTIAFAGICQAVKLVQDIARNGQCDNDALHTSLNSIVVTDPKGTVEVFGKEENLMTGLKVMVEEFDTGTNGGELTHYLINILALERKLSARRDSLAQLGDRISTIQRQITHFDLLDDQMISNLASVYLDTISPLGPRIQVTGSPAQLQQTGVQHKVRALLLSGMRSAVLWRQVGGKRRHLIFGRKSMIEQAKIILARHS